jgi:hypothetical protein
MLIPPYAPEAMLIAAAVVGRDRRPDARSTSGRLLDTSGGVSQQGTVPAYRSDRNRGYPLRSYSRGSNVRVKRVSRNTFSGIMVAALARVTRRPVALDVNVTPSAASYSRSRMTPIPREGIDPGPDRSTGATRRALTLCPTSRPGVHAPYPNQGTDRIPNNG